MKRVLVVGGGPAGLLIALELEKLGIEVALVDLRLNNYNRPGVLNKTVFDAVSKLIEEPIQPSSSCHIKDLENGLFAKVLQSKIKLHVASFVDINNHKISIKNTDGSIEYVEADMIIDASGSNQVVVKKVNDLFSQSLALPFNVPVIADVLNREFLIAYVKVGDEEVELLKKVKEKKLDIDPLNLIRYFTELRKLDWDAFIFPELHFQILNKNKVCFYVELPKILTPNLKELWSLTNTRELWLQKVLQLYTGKADFSFQQIPSKNKDKTHVRFNAFPIHLKMVVEAFFKHDDFPLVMVIGEARYSSIFQVGLGIEHCLQDVKALKETISVNKNEFAIDLDKYENLVKINQEKYISEIKAFANQYKTYVMNSLLRLHTLYVQAYDTCTNKEEKLSLGRDYTKFCVVYADTLYAAGLSALNEVLDNKGKIVLDQYHMVSAKTKNTLEAVIKLFLEALSFIPASTELAKKILNSIRKIVSAYRDLSQLYCDMGKYGFAIKYLDLAKDILNQLYSSNVNELEIIIINLKLINVCCQSQAYARAYDYVKEVDKKVAFIEAQQETDLLGNFYYLKTYTQLKLIQVGLMPQNQKTVDACQKQINFLIDNNYLNQAEIAVLMRNLNALVELTTKAAVTKKKVG